MHIAQGQKEAQEALQQLLQLDPPPVQFAPNRVPPPMIDLSYEARNQRQGDYAARRNLGAIYVRTEHSAKEYKQLQEASRRGLEDPKTLFYLGVAREKTGRTLLSAPSSGPRRCPKAPRTARSCRGKLRRVCPTPSSSPSAGRSRTKETSRERF